MQRVRRHLKALSTESVSSRGGRFASLLRGVGATRATSRRGNGSSAPAARRLALPLAVFVAILVSVGVGTALAVSAPSVEDTSASAVTGKSAVLEATINPNGEQTTFQFEYGLADCSSNPCDSVPLPASNVGAGEEPVDVSAEVSGLQAGTTYHYLVVASNGLGTTEGSDKTFTTFAAAPAQSCSNSVFRVGSSAALPDCRAYEMVSPVDKNGGDIAVLCNFNCNYTAHRQAALSGDQITYSSYKAFGDVPGSFYSNQYLATRSASGWTTHGIGPLHASKVFQPEYNAPWDLDLVYKAFTPDLRYAFLMDDAEPALTPEGIDGIGNLYKRDNLDGSFEAQTTIAPSAAGGQGDAELRKKKIGEPWLAGMSEDGTHAIWNSKAEYPGVTTNTESHVYDYTNGELRLVSVLPDGTENTEHAAITASERSNFISDDGSRIFWVQTAGFETNGDIFVRIDNSTTVPVSEGVASNATFLAADSTGSTAYFTNGAALYEFDVDSETPTKITDKFERFYGVSDDGSYFYFVSGEDLATGATADEPNLYVQREGTVEYIATLDEQDVGDGPFFGGAYDEQYVTPDGSHIAFVSHASLTGFDNTDASSGESDLEVFRYAASGHELTCVSCNPTNARPQGRPLVIPSRGDERLRFNAGQGTEWGSALLTVLTTQESIYGIEHEIYVPRVVSDDGTRVFFNSYDELVPGDTNGAMDVYEWQEQGTGGCQRPEGCLSLISSGESPADSEFVDSSPSGRDAFFLTTSSLLPQDPGLIDLYNAREGGGFPQPITPAACEGEACQGLPSPPNDPTPASSTYNGPGNVKAPAKKKAQKKKHKKKHKKQGKHKKKSGRASSGPRNATHRNG